jgi:hypothetical protein
VKVTTAGRKSARRDGPVGFGGTLALLISAGALVAGCGSPAANGPARQPQPASSTTGSSVFGHPAEAAIKEAVPVGGAGGTVAVTGTDDDVDPGRLFAPPRGRRYFAAEVRGCAGPTERGVMFQPDYFSVQVADHTVYDAERVSVKKPDLHGGPIPPGGCLDGWLTFVVPRSQPALAVIYDGSHRVTWSVTPPPAKP